jgi:hypothetical protein
MEPSHRGSRPIESAIKQNSGVDRSLTRGRSRHMATVTITVAPFDMLTTNS